MRYFQAADACDESLTSHDEIEETTQRDVPEAEEVIKKSVNQADNEPTPKRHKTAKTKVKEVAACIKDLNSLATQDEIQQLLTRYRLRNIAGTSTSLASSRCPSTYTILTSPELNECVLSPQSHDMISMPLADNSASILSEAYQSAFTVHTNN
ncbi:hypothetical protein PPYR_01062 [Photinus pyralis]|uniref:Uncharacterized protein n=1 Tax=Photinus pyralis TaxID=7054 RepID=A0A5N4B3B8_PHOPY|nr:hypothetical protein PPYR_01062 [Photinus pyralis]